MKYEQRLNTKIIDITIDGKQFDYVESIDDTNDKIVLRYPFDIEGIERGLITDIKFKIECREFSKDKSIQEMESKNHEIEYKNCLLIRKNRTISYDSAPSTEYIFLKY